MKQCCVKIFSAVLTVVVLCGDISAQGQCGTVVTPEYMQSLRNLVSRRLIIPSINKTINVTAWIVKDKSRTPSHDSTDVINAIAGLDSFFQQMGVSFTVCKINYIDNWQFNTWDKTVHDDAARVLYYQPNTINIYFTGDIAVPAGAGGYAPLPPSDDYIVIKTLGSLRHEMGHFFGLPHTFEGGNELADGSNCLTAGDLICDTEADPDPSGKKVDCDCNYIGPPLRDANGDFYEPPTDNIMSSYSPPSPPCFGGTCRCRFTPGQYLVMSQQFTLHRGNLW